MIYYLQHGGFYEWLSVALLIAGFIIYIGFVASWIMFGAYLCIECDAPRKGALTILTGISFFIITLAIFVVMSVHR